MVLPIKKTNQCQLSKALGNLKQYNIGIHDYKLAQLTIISNSSSRTLQHKWHS